jgi:hypothetical protein
MWLVVSTPLTNISGWDDYPYIMEKLKMFQTTNHIYVYDIIYIYIILISSSTEFHWNKGGPYVIRILCKPSEHRASV